MAGKNRELLRGLEQELRFLTEIGLEFVFSSNKDKQGFLHSLEAEILRCTRCPLSRGRIQAVPGEGSYDAPLMFVGEGPGADEDVQGRPFVGKAGQLLTRIIAAMNYGRQDVYITNVVKCRPPQNRTPAKDEIEKCRPYLLAQIESIAPRVIVCLGKVATDFFHPSAAGMSSLRGSFIEYGKILVMPTFHPSYLIRNEGNKEIKRLVWQDMQKVMEALSRK